MLVPVTEALYNTVLGVDAVLMLIEAGAAGVDVTETRSCLPPLPGAWAMHPPRGSRTAATINRKIAEDKKFRTEPSDSQKAIEENSWGGKREVYSVIVILSCSIRPVNLELALVALVAKARVSQVSRVLEPAIFALQAKALEFL